MLFRTAFARFALNFIVYLVFGGAILAFTAMRGPAPAAFSDVVGGALGLALWSGALTSLIEVKVMKLDDVRKRVGLAMLLGALSLGGFAAILSLVAWRAPQLGFIAIGIGAGALMQGARAFSLGGARPSAADHGAVDDGAAAGAGGAGAAGGAAGDAAGSDGAAGDDARGAS